MVFPAAFPYSTAISAATTAALNVLPDTFSLKTLDSFRVTGTLNSEGRL
jgi:hypothetical protein